MLDDFPQAFGHSTEDRPERLQFFIPQEMVVSWSNLRRPAPTHVLPRLRPRGGRIVEAAVAFSACF